MTARPFIVTPGDYADALDIVGEHVTVLASGEVTGGYEVFLPSASSRSSPCRSDPGSRLRSWSGWSRA
jgi:hypothetical protein